MGDDTPSPRARRRPRDLRKHLPLLPPQQEPCTQVCPLSQRVWAQNVLGFETFFQTQTPGNKHLLSANCLPSTRPIPGGGGTLFPKENTHRTHKSVGVSRV